MQNRVALRDTLGPVATDKQRVNYHAPMTRRYNLLLCLLPLAVCNTVQLCLSYPPVIMKRMQMNSQNLCNHGDSRRKLFKY